MAASILRSSMRAGAAMVRASVAVAPAARTQFMAMRAASSGTVKWFNVNKGYGFVTVDDAESEDVFVHQTAIQSGGFRFLREGERVEFDTVETDRGVQASNVTGVGGVPLDRTRMDYAEEEEH